MTEQQKPRVIRRQGYLGEKKFWGIAWDNESRDVFVDPTVSADELRAIADKMEEYELDELRKLWGSQARVAWSETHPGHDVQLPYLVGFITARENDYRERHGMPRLGESHDS